ncbi:MAG: DUF4830 domain-containing protein [Clostridia bacterium]|nr:DUF4830 domain-containing protein [Clostridia bacterium]
MFIYSLRASTIKFFGVVALSLIALFGLMIFVPQYEAAEAVKPTEETVDYTGIRTNEDRIAFIGQFGYTVEPEPLESSEFVLPEEFDRVLAGYNEIQKQQGLDLSRYRKKSVTRYTYTVTNYEEYEGTVYVNLIVFRDRVVGCDICSADPSGFVEGLFLKE